MSKNRDLGVGALLGYMVIWWGLVAGLLVFVTSNAAPGEPVLKWAEEEATTTTKLAVEIDIEAPDADGDKIAYSYSWTKNGELALNSKGEPFASKSISSKQTMAGDVWEVTVVPNDGSADGWGCSLPWRECAGNVAVSQEVTIGNTPPRARVRFINPDATEDMEPSIVDWDGKSDIELELSCFDPDVIDLQRKEREEAAAAGEPEPEPEPEPAEGEEAEEEEDDDPCTYTVGWWAADAEIEEGATSEITALRLTRRELKANDSWKVIVVANDGTDDGDPVEETISKLE